MAIYKDANNQLHEMDAEGFEHLLPAGAVEISAAEAASLRAAQIDPAEAVRQQIAELEASVTPRRLREAVLTGDHSFVESVDKQIAALRRSI